MASTVSEPIEFDVDGQTYSLRLGFAAIVRLERAHDKPIGAIMRKLSGDEMRFDDLLTLFHACMVRDAGIGDGTENVSIDEAAQLVDTLGLDRTMALVNQAVEESPIFSKPEVEKPKVRGAGPGKRAKAG